MKLTVSRELRSQKTVCFLEQIVAADKYPSIFSHQMEAIVYLVNGGYCVYYPSNIFRNTHSFENWGIFGHVTCLDQSRAGENIDGL